MDGEWHKCLFLPDLDQRGVQEKRGENQMSLTAMLRSQITVLHLVKPFGICLNVSHKIMWMDAFMTSRDPKLLKATIQRQLRSSLRTVRGPRARDDVKRRFLLQSAL